LTSSRPGLANASRSKSKCARRTPSTATSPKRD
jgi:hypothetical protein